MFVPKRPKTLWRPEDKSVASEIEFAALEQQRLLEILLYQDVVRLARLFLGLFFDFRQHNGLILNRRVLLRH